MIKRLTTALAALAFALGLVLAVGPASPALATSCDAWLAPSAGHGATQDNGGSWSYKSWTAIYIKDEDHSSPCVDIQIRNYLRSGCLTPQDGGTFARVRLFLSTGQSVGPNYYVPCGSSTYVVLAHNQPDGTRFWVEVDFPNPPNGDASFNIQIMD